MIQTEHRDDVSEMPAMQPAGWPGQNRKKTSIRRIHPQEKKNPLSWCIIAHHEQKICKGYSILIICFSPFHPKRLLMMMYMDCTIQRIFLFLLLTTRPVHVQTELSLNWEIFPGMKSLRLCRSVESSSQWCVNGKYGFGKAPFEINQMSKQ